mmetsp:Transcript_43431/g.94599  ORF Transcript_43431/g.94599 Transcript_43431/m.94599 type:complete len:236 (+) Transcript_43431:48-755(+)
MATADPISKFESRAPPTRSSYSVDVNSPWKPDDNILEEFEIDLELAAKFYTDQACWGMLMAPYCWPLVPLVYTCIRANATDVVWGLWLAVSKENVYVVRRRHKSCLRCYCCDVGEIRKVIPVANVQDVMITGPAGTAVCCFVPNVLHTVEIQTAASGGISDGAVGRIQGLKDPQRFRDVVLGLKKEAGGGAGLGSGGPAPQMVGAPTQQTMEQLLATNREILEVLKDLKETCGKK